jgi:hypothetical protein
VARIEHLLEIAQTIYWHATGNHQRMSSSEQNLFNTDAMRAACEDDGQDLSGCLEQLLVNGGGSSEPLANCDSSDIGISTSDIARTAEDSTNDGSVSVGPSEVGEEGDRRNWHVAHDADSYAHWQHDDRKTQLVCIPSYPGNGGRGHRRNWSLGSDWQQSQRICWKDQKPKERRVKKLPVAQASSQHTCDFRIFTLTVRVALLSLEAAFFVVSISVVVLNVSDDDAAFRQSGPYEQ